jgi:enoyl-[acyl-carrier protein] reductase I
VYRQVDAEFGGLDILVHSVAYAPKEALEGTFLATRREDFTTCLDVSAYSLIGLVRPAVPLMEKRGGGSIVTMTFQASERVFPRYNVMAVAKAALETNVRYLAYELGPKNIRVNAISAGPVKTLAARGVPGFTKMEHHVEVVAPLRKATEAAEVGDVALFLCSSMARGITFSDSGYHILGITSPEFIV